MPINLANVPTNSGQVSLMKTVAANRALWQPPLCSYPLGNHAEKTYAKIAALRRIKRLVPSDVMISLYKAYVLPHLEYCCPLLLAYLKSWKITSNVPIITRSRHLNLDNSATYYFCLAMAAMDTLEIRRTLQSLILFFKCFKLDSPNYISQFFTPRLTKYNLRDSSLNVVQPPYNNLVMHNSWLPTYGINYTNRPAPNPPALKHNFVLAWIMLKS